MLVGGSPSNSANTKSNDKLKLNETGAAGCEAINSLFLVISRLPALLKEFSAGIELLPSLAHTVTILLDCAVLGEDNIELQLNSLEALLTLTSVIMKDGDILAPMTPAIVSKMTKILAQRDSKRHYTVLVKAVDLFGSTLGKTFNDASLSLFQKTDEIPLDVKAFRTRSWLTASKAQVKLSLNTVAPLRSHSKHEVLAALLRFSLDLLTSSSYALDNCVSMFIDSVVAIASFENSVTPKLTETAYFQLGLILAQNESVRDVLKERVYDWIESLPRLLTASDESQGVLVLSCIITSMKVMSSFLSAQCTDIEYFQNLLLRTLQEALVLKPSVRLLPGVLPQSSELTKMAMSTALTPVSKDVNLFTDLGFDLMNKSLEIKLREALSFTGALATTSTGFESLMLQLQDPRSLSTKTLVTWMAVNTFEGIVKSGSDEFNNWLLVDDTDVSQLSRPQKDDLALEMYSFCSDVFTEANSSSLSRGSLKKESERYSDAILCFSLQGMESVARYMGQDFKSELMDVLYPLVDFLGSPNVAVRQSAQKTIITVAQSCQYSSLRELLVDNSDYVIDTLSSKLNTLDFSPQGPLNLKTLIKLTGIKIIPYLDDVIESLFVILDNYHGYSMITNGVFQALESVVDETSKGYNQLLLENTSKDPLVIEARFVHTTKFEDLVKSLTVKPQIPDFYDAKGVNQDDDFVAHDGKPFKADASAKDAEMADSDDEDDQDLTDFNEGDIDLTTSMDNDAEQDLKEWSSPVPKSSYDLIQKITGYTDRYLTHESANLRKLLLDLTSKSLPVLASNQEQFLPLVNSIWPVLVTMLSLDDNVNNSNHSNNQQNINNNNNNNELFIVEAVLQVIGELCRYARDFMTTRITEVWHQKIKLFIIALPIPQPTPNRTVNRKLNIVSHGSSGQRDHFFPKYSSERRILDSVISCLAQVAKYTRLDTSVFFEMLEFTGPFLDMHNYSDLKDSLSEINSDAVWFELVKPKAKSPSSSSGSRNISQSQSQSFSIPSLDEKKYPMFLPFVI